MKDQIIEKNEENSRRKFLKSSLASAAAVSLPIAVTSCSNAQESSETAVKEAAPEGLRTRKNVMNLTAQEKADFTNGILALKKTPSPFFKNNLLSYYDSLVRMHQLAVIQARNQGFGVGHKCPALLTFHRKLVLLLEDGLRTVTKKDIAVPYWDWTNADSVPVVFADDFMGPNIGDPTDNYAVTSGPFKKGDYELNLITVPDGDTDYLNFCPFPFLTRGAQEGNDKLPAMLAGLSLPTQAEVDDALAISAYDAAPFDPTVDRATSFRNYLGGWGGAGGAPTLHNVVHSWTGGAWNSSSYRFLPAAVTLTDGTTVGPGWVSSPRYYVGTMQALQTSANDPVFFIHHANVDRIWAQWEKKWPDSPFVPESGGKAGWNLNDEITPYAAHKDVPEMMKTGITNASMLGIENLGYTYEEL